MSLLKYKVSVDSSGRRSLVRVPKPPLSPPRSTMRPWKRERPSPPPPQQQQPPDSPRRPGKGSLSSMVVKLSDDELAQARRHHRSPSPPRTRTPDDPRNKFAVHSSSPSRRQRTDDSRYDHYFHHRSQPDGRREFRDEKNGGGFRDKSPMYDRGRGRTNLRDISPLYLRVTDEGRIGEFSVMDGHGRGDRRLMHSHFSRGRGRGRSFPDLSPPTFLRERHGRRDVSPDFEQGRDRGRMRDLSPAYIPGKDDRRFRDISPIYEPERNGGRVRGISPHNKRENARGVNAPHPDPLPFRDEGLNRNNPNIPPRVGDWICRNPSCGNLNFARREFCNSCNIYRYEPEEAGQAISPRRQYSSGRGSIDPLPIIHPVGRGPERETNGYRSPPLIRPVDRGLERETNGYRSPPLIRPVDRALERETNGYRSPPRSWSRDSPRGPLRDVVRYPDGPRHREFANYRGEIEHRAREDKFDRHLSREWDHQERGRSSSVQGRRGYDHATDNWGPRERSRSPHRVQPPKETRHSSFGGRGHGDRPGIARGRGGDLF